MLRPLALGLLVVAGAVLASAGDAPSGRLALEAGVAPARLAPLPPPVDDTAGAAHAFAAKRRDGTARPVLFDPCRPVQWVVRREGEPPGGDALLVQAADEVARTTGLELVRGPDVTGPLPAEDEQARRGADGAFPPALVAWSSEQERPELAGGTLAVGGGTAWAPDGRWGEERLVSGLVVLDAPDLAEVRSGPDGEARLRGALLHELAHLIGLGHVDDPSQLLHPSSTRTGFGAGDLRGLRAAGEGQCFQDW